MARKSDSRTKRISATEAGRSFSRTLDQVERGKSFVIHRHGRDICQMIPVAVGSRKVSECLSIVRSRPDVTLDDGFSRDLMEIIAGEKVEDRPWA